MLVNAGSKVLNFYQTSSMRFRSAWVQVLADIFENVQRLKLSQFEVVKTSKKTSNTNFNRSS